LVHYTPRNTFHRLFPDGATINTYENFCESESQDLAQVYHLLNSPRERERGKEESPENNFGSNFWKFRHTLWGSTSIPTRRDVDVCRDPHSRRRELSLHTILVVNESFSKKLANYIHTLCNCGSVALEKASRQSRSF
jgi:hypothetical protein